MGRNVSFYLWVQANRFWITCFVVSLLCGTAWNLACRSLQQQRNAAEATINAVIASGEKVLQTRCSGIQQIHVHPNDQTEQGMDQQIDLASISMAKAWEARRSAQEPLLKWPELPNRKFMQTIARLRPAEKYMRELSSAHLDSSLAVYQAEIPGRMVPLTEIIRSRWQFSDKQNSADPVVVWSDSNQELWNEKLTRFQGIDGQPGAHNIPTPIQVMALQQDLWLLEAVFRIIRDVNGDAASNDLAVVKRIDHVVFGREARSTLGKLTAPDPELASGKTTREATQLPSEENGRSAFGTGRASRDGFNPELGVEHAMYAPFHGRYVDAGFNPISAQVLLETLNASGGSVDYPELVVAKRVPVRLAIRMDDRKIDELIAACANSPFALEVRQVRINRPRGKISLAGVESSNDNKDGVDDYKKGTVTSGDRGKSLSDMSTDDNEAVGDQSNSNVELRTSYDASVELYGIVKIYNPVDLSAVPTREGASDDRGK